ncbi:uncharacterized protein LOC105421547 [Amborella trichopoda]|uniref:uncharacterized protein LOC105421547 n=1 Tax=Amborella trichopoda TaxID=13333 RepID=UPI0005D334D4|nr:uncharacterized protein LOC105421547 [Amborella trichopoda]|eukprot:XP_011627634.1 uncharacterized protein LOC105421547 [Amborella trichopoda]
MSAGVVRTQFRTIENNSLSNLQEISSTISHMISWVGLMGADEEKLQQPIDWVTQNSQVITFDQEKLAHTFPVLIREGEEAYAWHEEVAIKTRMKMLRARGYYASSNDYNTEALGEFCRTLGAMTQLRKKSMPALSTPNLEHNDCNLIERFKRLAPSTFLGQGSVEKAERWLMQVEKIFEVLQCSDELKLRLGAFMLEGDAEHWWHSVQQDWKDEIIPTWEGCLEAFSKKYFPESVKERKEVEFIELQQGNLIVDQYVAKFLELSRYVPHIMNMEARKAIKKVEKDCDDHRLRKEKQRTGPPPFGGPQEKESRRNGKAQKISPGDVKQSQLIIIPLVGSDAMWLLSAG